MNSKFNIPFAFVALFLLVCGGCFHSCQEDDLGKGGYMPDKDALIAQGRYLTARAADAFILEDDQREPQPFPVGTPYRLFAFSKPYNPEDNAAEAPVPCARFNTVAWEGVTPGGLRFFNVDGKPDRMFGFLPYNDAEVSGKDGLVSLDFYGFTYGDSLDGHPSDYIPVVGWDSENGIKGIQLGNLKHTETITPMSDNRYTDLKDLMRGVLLDQNIETAGMTIKDGVVTANPYTQSVMEFYHCFSKLRIQVSQQGDEDHPDKDGNPTPVFDNLYIEDITITGTYESGTVSLGDGKVEVSGGTTERKLLFDKDFTKKVTVSDADAGEMIIFPSDGGSLSNSGLSDGYDVGLKIKVKSTVRKDIENMLRNTGSLVDGEPVITETTEDGTTWYLGTIVKNNIIDYYTPGSTNSVLHFKQNTSYVLIITFKDDAVRIITVIPQIEEWLNGEGTYDDPWQTQDLGMPQMFDNILWSDRNLGADSYDPTDQNFELAIGYYYQPHRNIPYFPYNTKDYFEEDGKILATPKVPVPEDKRKKELYVAGSYSSTTHRLYPMVDKAILNMLHQVNGYSKNGGVKGGNYAWFVRESDAKENGDPKYDDRRPQMDIPEKTPTNTYFDVYEEILNKDDMKWDIGQQYQPVKGSWVVPSSRDFMSIFPSTPYAGNFAFRGGGDNTTPMDGWGHNNGAIKPIADSHETIRVTVPFYYKGMEKPGKTNFNGKTQKEKDEAKAMYEQAWNRLYKYKNPITGERDPGTTHLGDGTYVKEPNWNNNLSIEPSGDPEDGYASVYVISRKSGDKSELSQPAKDYRFPGDGKYTITSWGTIYAIKRIYTSQAYRMRWRVICAKGYGTVSKPQPAFYVEICRYRCNAGDELTEENFDDYDWDHPAAKIYFPICGLCEKGFYYNFGTECHYATSDAVDTSKKVGVLQIKVTGDDPSNTYIAIMRNVVNRNFGMQIRPVGGVIHSK